MFAQRITGIMDGEFTPLGDGPPILSSTGSQWSGFLLEEHIINEPREEVAWTWHSTHVAICTAGSSVISVSGAAGNSRFATSPGIISLYPGGCDQTTILHSGGGHRFVVVELDTTRLDRLLQDEDASRQQTLLPQINIKDPQMAALLANMHAEITDGGHTGPLYHDSLCLALATYLSGRYAAKTAATDRNGVRFSGSQQRRVIDYIQTHLGQEFDLQELAAALNLGPRHFSRLFRNTLGTTPYRYVVNERIRQARMMLAKQHLSIVEIAQALGFASQSHFSTVFQKATGISPRRYRQQG